MSIWFLRGLRRGVVTTRYPAVTDRWAAQLPSPPLFVPAHLTAELVERLVAICPSKALAREGAYLVLDVGACTACGRCLKAAGPAPRPSGVFELAATSRERLLKRIPVKGGPP